jgi:hypothetical protein
MESRLGCATAAKVDVAGEEIPADDEPTTAPTSFSPTQEAQPVAIWASAALCTNNLAPIEDIFSQQREILALHRVPLGPRKQLLSPLDGLVFGFFGRGPMR